MSNYIVILQLWVYFHANDKRDIVMWNWIQSVLGNEQIEFIDPLPPVCSDCVYWARDGFGRSGECVAHYSNSNIYLSADGRPARLRMATLKDFHCKNFLKRELTQGA